MILKKIKRKVIFGILTICFIFGTDQLLAQQNFGWKPPLKEQINSTNALRHYLNNGDSAFQWTIKDSIETEDAIIYGILFTSQHWQQYTWKHQLTLIVPRENTHDGALLFIAGGHNDTTTGMPSWSKLTGKGLYGMIAQFAGRNKAAVAILRQVPNQPLFGGKTEDQIISYTFKKYQEDTTNYSWPLLFPMVKSTERAMDLVQIVLKKKFNHEVNRFVISGASKRGWTTWLTAASGDPRVAAVGPMVIDILNMPVNLAHQMDFYGAYSRQIQDYVDLGIVEGMHSKKGRALVNMIDPYSYRKVLTMPKMIFMGTNDAYWVIDNVKNYYSGLSGTTLLNYTPNAGHGLNKGMTALPALSAFFGLTMNHQSYPKCTWKTKEKKNGVHLKVKVSKGILKEVKLWSADSEDKDFRDEKFKNKKIKIQPKSTLKVHVSYPSKGYRAFYVELRYKAPNGGSYTVCTRAFVVDQRHVL